MTCFVIAIERNDTDTDVIQRHETKITSEKNPINSGGDINPSSSQTDKHTDKGEAERARAGPDTNIDS